MIEWLDIYNLPKLNKWIEALIKSFPDKTNKAIKKNLGQDD